MRPPAINPGSDYINTPVHSPHNNGSRSPGPRTSINKSSGMLREIMYINPPSNINDFYDFGSILGKGGFGVVTEILHAKTFQPFAGKATKKTSLKTAEEEATFRQVIELLINFEDKRIVKLLHIFEDDKNYYMVMQKCMAALDSLIRSNLRVKTKEEPYAINASRLQDLSRQIVLGVNFLHSHNVLHRDIKPENIMIEGRINFEKPNFGDEPMCLKLVDFDMCVLLDAESDSKQTDYISGTACYMAPEIFETRTYSRRSDIFAIGGTLYFLVTEKTPCPGISLSPRFKTRELHHMMWSWSANETDSLLNVGEGSAWSRLPECAISLIRVAVEKKTSDRWATCDAMLDTDWLWDEHCSDSPSSNSSALGSGSRGRPLSKMQRICSSSCGDVPKLEGSRSPKRGVPKVASAPNCNKLTFQALLLEGE